MCRNEACDSAASSLCVECVAKTVGPLWSLRVAVHRVAVAVERIEARVGVPGLVEVNPIDARIEQLLDAPRVVAEPVVGGVGDDRIARLVASMPFVTSGFALIAALIASLLQPFAAGWGR